MVPQRRIVDQVSGWLTVYDDGFVDRTWTGPPQFKFLSDPVPPHHHFINGVATHDLSIHPDSDHRVRVYLPDLPDSEKLPIILHFHGGGFCISQADWFMYYNTYTRLAREAGAIIVSTYLPLAPEHRLPAAVDKAHSTLVWLQDLANGKVHQPLVSSKGDFTRVFLVGDSTGGNIVHQLAKTFWPVGDLLRPVRMVGAVLIQPGFLRSVKSKSELEKLESPFFTRDMLYKNLYLGLPEGSTLDHPITCPMGEGDTLQGFDLPPYLMCVAEDDMMIDTEMEFYQEIKKAGRKVELLVSHGVGDGFYLNKIAIDADPNTSEETRKLIQGISHFMQNN